MYNEKIWIWPKDLKVDIVHSKAVEGLADRKKERIEKETADHIQRFVSKSELGTWAYLHFLLNFLKLFFASVNVA